MKLPRYEFQWFEREDHRRRHRASVSPDGLLRLGRLLCQSLPPFIRLGFDARQKVLAIANGRGEGIPLPRCGVVSARKLSAQIAATGLRLPVKFLFAEDPATGLFLGRVLPTRCRAAGPGRETYDTEQLRILYQHLIDFAVGSLARSTPLAERKASALEAFYAAVRDYRPGYGDLEAYLAAYIQRHLLTENRPYAAAYTQRSLDQPLVSGEGETFCLYDTLPAADAGGIDRVEERIMAEQFWRSLSAREQTLSRMLREGRSLPQIAQALRLPEDRLMAMGRAIGEKRRQFYNAP